MRKSLSLLGLGLLILFLLEIPISAIHAGATVLPLGTDPNTWVIEFYPCSYPSGVSPSNYSVTVNFTIPGFTHTSGCYLAFVLTTWVEASEYTGIVYSGTVYLALQLGVVFVYSSNTYVINEQVWTCNGNEIYHNYTLVTTTIHPNVETLITLLYRYDNGYVATGILQECTSPITLIDVHYPTSYRYGCTIFYVINTYGFTDPS
ncbi:conserved pro-fuselloviral protein [Acidianus hospitalis W1]|uniref:Conserved pro-fuselloviral protein n=1 Tax=Acidianus hospitalis (strain W1) TaxID=933801 RepID=F4B6V7_ACIHW|nr:hypothetical protein [Acidianus hospitalis]AEE94650.1 conserved pro-fuselloviral protein [Acidianus hospitalis W1]